MKINPTTSISTKNQTMFGKRKDNSKVDCCPKTIDRGPVVSIPLYVLMGLITAGSIITSPGCSEGNPASPPDKPTNTEINWDPTGVVNDHAAHQPQVLQKYAPGRKLADSSGVVKDSVKGPDRDDFGYIPNSIEKTKADEDAPNPDTFGVVPPPRKTPNKD